MPKKIEGLDLPDNEYEIIMERTSRIRCKLVIKAESSAKAHEKAFETIKKDYLSLVWKEMKTDYSVISCH